MSTLLNWFEPQLASLLPDLMLLFGMALLISAIGFYRAVYFISIGYAFSIVAMAIVMPIRHLDSLWWVSVLQNGLLVLWGLRLGIYLVRREYQASYRKEMTNVQDRSSGMAWWTKVIIWISVSLLYVTMTSPALFGLVAVSGSTSWVSTLLPLLGLLIMSGGFILETVADQQKSTFKASSPHQYCDVGSYRWVRCSNYLGEILFWVGNWTIGLVIYDSPMKWTVGLVGVVCIVLIMMGSTKRLESSQDARYGDQDEYQKYIRTVPVLFPFAPLYSLKNVRVYLE
jgi:steroid 5-alpha reductase family enzyme